MLRVVMPAEAGSTPSRAPRATHNRVASSFPAVFSAPRASLERNSNCLFDFDLSCASCVSLILGPVELPLCS